MNKKGFMIGMTAAAMMGLTACGTEVPDLSKLDNDKAAEYMAGAMLKYDSEYEYALQYDHSILNATPTPSPTAVPAASPTPDGSAEPGGTPNAASGTGEEPELQQVSLTDVYGLPGVSLEYISANMKKSYGKDYESIVASGDKKILMIYFNVKNTSDAAQRVDLSKNKPTFALHQGDRSIAPLHTAAEGDLLYFDTKIAPGKSEQGVLMFEVDADTKMTESSLLVTNGTKQAVIPLS